MRTIKQILMVIIITMIIPTMAYSQTKKEVENWERLINAISKVESGGDSNAKSKDCVGILQIRPILVRDCNEYLKMKGSDKRYTLKDRYSVEKSKEMFTLYQKRYNPSGNIEKAIRLWNGGCGYSIEKTNAYYKKVMKHY